MSLFQRDQGSIMKTLADAWNLYSQVKNNASKSYQTDLNRWTHINEHMGHLSFTVIKSYTILEFRSQLEKKD